LCLALAAVLWGRPKDTEKDNKQTRVLDANGARQVQSRSILAEAVAHRWSMQQVTGLYVEERTINVWFLNRAAAADGDEIGGEGNPPRIICCISGTDGGRTRSAGNVVQAWGGPGYIPEWPTACRRDRGPAKQTSGLPGPPRIAS